MEMIYFTLAAIVLYLVSDKIVNLIEQKRGERLQNRSILFFAIILALSIVMFNAIQYFYRGVELEDNQTLTPVPATNKTQ